jgi:hypothetical protein
MVEKVIFRVDKDGVFGFYPEIPAGHWSLCKSTRGPIDPHVRGSHEATPVEYAALKESIDPVTVVKRETVKMRQLRKDCIYIGELN